MGERTKTGDWLGFSVRSPRDQAACKSWFAGLLGDDDKVLFAEGFERWSDDTMPRIRVLAQRADGRLIELQRRQSKRNWTVSTQPPSAAIRARPGAIEALRALATQQQEPASTAQELER